LQPSRKVSVGFTQHENQVLEAKLTKAQVKMTFDLIDDYSSNLQGPPPFFSRYFGPGSISDVADKIPQFHFQSVYFHIAGIKKSSLGHPFFVELLSLLDNGQFLFTVIYGDKRLGLEKPQSPDVVLGNSTNRNIGGTAVLKE